MRTLEQVADPAEERGRHGAIDHDHSHADLRRDAPAVLEEPSQRLVRLVRMPRRPKPAHDVDQIGQREQGELGGLSMFRRPEAHVKLRE